MTGSAEIVLFVYGSLKRGQANHHELSAARFLCSALTARAFALRELAGYPALVPGDRAIAGELYQLPARRLSALDAFEGDAYVRRQIELSDGERAIAYLARSAETGTPWPFCEWPAPRT